MTTMNISLPDEMKAFIEAQVAQEGFASTSEYLRALIREAQKRKVKQRLEAKIREAVESGPATPMTHEDWVDLLKNPEVHSWVARVVEEIMKTKASYEKIKYFALLDKELTLESGELTPTLKVKRRVVMQNYATVIEDLYRQGDAHQAALLRKD